MEKSTMFKIVIHEVNDTLRVKMLNYCYENFGMHGEWQYDPMKEPQTMTFFFKDKSHATLFALRWL